MKQKTSLCLNWSNRGEFPESVGSAVFDLTEQQACYSRVVQMTGFPNGGSSELIEGEIKAIDDRGRFQIDPMVSDRVVEAGFSGAGIYDPKQQKVLGILVSRKEKYGVVIAYGIPVSTIRKSILLECEAPITGFAVDDSIAAVAAYLLDSAKPNSLAKVREIVENALEAMEVPTKSRDSLHLLRIYGLQKEIQEQLNKGFIEVVQTADRARRAVDLIGAALLRSSIAPNSVFELKLDAQTRADFCHVRELLRGIEPGLGQNVEQGVANTVSPRTFEALCTLDRVLSVAIDEGSVSVGYLNECAVCVKEFLRTSLIQASG